MDKIKITEDTDAKLTVSLSKGAIFPIYASVIRHHPRRSDEILPGESKTFDFIFYNHNLAQYGDWDQEFAVSISAGENIQWTYDEAILVLQKKIKQLETKIKRLEK